MTGKPLHKPAPAAARPARPAKALRRRGAARSIPEHAASVAQADAGLLEHPDGWYWVPPDGRQQFGPFESAALALADRDRAGEESVNEAEAEREAELELGVSDAVREGVESVVDDDGADGGPSTAAP